MSKEHKKVDENCMSLTASFVRAKHDVDSSVPICDYYEVCVVCSVVARIQWPYCIITEFQHCTVEDD